MILQTPERSARVHTVRLPVPYPHAIVAEFRDDRHSDMRTDAAGSAELSYAAGIHRSVYS